MATESIVDKMTSLSPRVLLDTPVHAAALGIKC